ncbi:chloride conductance regulatory protein ICln-like isoform X2 [Bidens hawaiensis]|uniref:chloride conductance regulatory protein ICln-like isoform X2 n=1 Tax=Bidens hawaiensis TaxID=980011 RepID=UPI00404928E3
MAGGLKPLTERSAAGTPVFDTAAGEEVMHVQPNVSVVLGNRPPESPGTLYISTKQVVWLSDTEMTKGYAVDFLSVSLHAVSRDPEAFESPCLYTQIDTGDEGDESESCDSEESDTLDLSKITEMRLVPSDPTQLDTIFNIFCECAELNPEPVAEDEEQQHNWIFSADQLGVEGDDPEWNDSDIPFTIGYSNGDHDLASSVLELQINDQRFEDAEEMGSDNSDDPHQ